MIEKNGLRIGDVARVAGLLPTTLRYYESIGLLPPPLRQNGSRRYDASVFQRLELIKIARQAGFTLDEVRILFDDILWNGVPSGNWHDLMRRKLIEVDHVLANVQQMKQLLEDILDCDDASLAECMVQTGQQYRQVVPILSNASRKGR